MKKKKRPRENKRGQMAKHGRLDLDQIRLLQRASSSLIKIFLLTFKGNIDNCLIIWERDVVTIENLKKYY